MLDGTDNVDAAVHLGEAALADVVQALELANDLPLARRSSRGRRRCARPARVRRGCHGRGAGWDAGPVLRYYLFPATNRDASAVQQRARCTWAAGGGRAFVGTWIRCDGGCCRLIDSDRLNDERDTGVDTDVDTGDELPQQQATGTEIQDSQKKRIRNLM
jgi:hypothetical protein